ncbi:hypothetical protein HYG77_37985 (plasmid) [Rhodococcus sp. ZPP]|uniref:hypothetical protein n=1 Tax=Rhodococcus sp. ZPP TaxID=2749906 RepID=UPI001AD8827E|nr:hypothetical protein [Rhodococcus sp. ZPP]QTJ71246.1 hypothetical protein HYG77_37985 [Rhodococcus sp. ZPP]
MTSTEQEMGPMVDSRFDGDNRVDESAIEDWFTAPPSPDSGNTDDAPADPADGVGRTAFSVVEGGNGLEDANAEEDDWFDVTSPILGARPETEPMPHQQGGSEWSDTDSTMGKPWPSTLLLTAWDRIHGWWTSTGGYRSEGRG